MLHCTNLSVHCGRDNRVEGGGVMEDGRILTPHPSYIQPLSNLTTDSWKSQSLPGFYNRPISPSPQTFKEAFTSSYSPFSKRKSPAQPSFKTNEGNTEKHHTNGNVEEKKSRSFLGGLFRRKKKEESSSSNSESDSDGFKRGAFFGKKLKKGEARLTPNTFNLNQSQVIMSPNKNGVTNPIHLHESSHYLSSTDKVCLIKMSPTVSLGRECNNISNDMQPIGIPYLPFQSNLGRKGVSLSHDSLAPSAASWNSESAYGSINSSMRSSRLGRSSSTDTLTRKGRREALKCRVEKLREKHQGGSSSEEDVASLSSQFGSENSLNKSCSSSRSRSSRTERYLRRKSLELETLKVETEKDKRNREIVQARILEIQKSQKLREAKKLGINGGDNENDKPKWSAKLVYQVSNQIDHEPFVITNLSESPSCSRAALRHLNAQITTSISPNPYSYSNNKFQIPPYCSTGIQSQRSVSYESNINQTSILPHNCVTKDAYVNSGGFLPPAPPPRDRSRLLSPCEPSRPSSYSFEVSNQDLLQAPHNTNGAPVPYRNSFHKESSPNLNRPLPPLSPNLNGIAQQLPPTGQCRRSMSEKHLTPTESVVNDINYRNTPSKAYIPPLNQFNSLSDFNRPNNLQQYSEIAYLSSSNLKPLNERNSQYTKGIPVTNVPPSPSSDYSSYVSDNSIRTSQIQPMSLPPEIIVHSHLTVKSCDPSNSNSLIDNSNQMNQGVAYSSLTGQSDLSSLTPLKQVENVGQVDSDSSQSSNKGITYKVSNRPLSIVVEKSESASGEKDSPLVNIKSKPEPPKRGSSSLTKKNRELLLKHLELIKELEKDETFIGRQKKFEEVFKKEKERLQKSKCTNFEEALHELEEIYKSLNLNSEDIMEGAERMDELNEQRVQLGENSSCKFSEDQIDGARSGMLPLRRASTPDKTKDDLHYRRVQLSNRNQPDVKKALQITGSYMLVSPVHVPPSPHVLEIPKDDLASKEPDTTFDDVTYRSTQRANSIKVIDPQPPFGIPLDPIKQTSHIDYLHTPSQLQSNDDIINSEEPDIVSDDMAFRNLRKDNKSASNKSLNVSELDEILSEANESPRIDRRMLRSASADRIITVYPTTVLTTKKVDNQTPRKVKQQQRAKRGGGKFIDSFKEALTDSESSSALNLKRNPSWVERANLCDNKWGNLSTSTETLTELSSVKAVSQPDIRHAIIRESRASSGGPFDSFSILEPESPTKDDPPHLVRINSFHNISSSPRMVNAKSYRPLDAMYNTKPKPFYIPNLPRNEIQLTQSPVDIAKLDDLISTLSSLESCDVSNGEALDNRTSNKSVSKSELKASNVRQFVANNCPTKEGNQLKNKANNLESPFTTSTSSNNSLDISVTNQLLPGPITPERLVVLSDEPSQELLSQAYRATMRTNKVESMLVTSQEVDDRDTRAKSVPPPPKPTSSQVVLPIKILIHKLPSNLDLPKPVPYSRPSSCLQGSTSDSYQSAVSTNVSLSSSSYLSVTSITEKDSRANSEENISPLKEDHLSISSTKGLQSACGDMPLNTDKPDSNDTPSNNSNELLLSQTEEEDQWVTPPSSTVESSKSSDSEESEGRSSNSATPGEDGRLCLSSSSADFISEEPLWYHWGFALIYVLVCLLHFSGLEIITAFGLILAMASVLVTFAN